MSRPLAPGFLIATPPLNDPNFERSLVLLVAHGEEGALGLVINGTKTVASVGDLLEQLGLETDTAGRNDPVRLGGPVQPEIGWIVYRPSAEAREGEIRLSDEVAVTQSREVLAAIGRHDGPEKYATYLGYAGWAPGQLEEEISHGSWLPTALLDEAIVFDVPVADRWQAAFDRAGVAPLGFMSTKRGSA
ncbi:MAG: YqgE/AlgH family protein [Myxococcales bacterium]|nr:YqgE/AlgH family protein [Myxococcales bacterium]MBL8716478.1 YqgE/AlgH family protein [Myxococcales bacterium]